MESETQISQNVRCAKCGAVLPADFASMASRPPCPACDEFGIAVELGIAEELDLAESLSVSLVPGDQSNGWERRWEEAQEQLRHLVSPRSGELSGQAIHAAQYELLNFFVHAYHIKDALKAESASIGLIERQIEDAIDANPTLALLADLANLNKHFELTKPPRSGHVPTIGPVKGTQSGSGDGGWRLELTVEHAGKTLDGLKIAREVIAEWQRQLAGWGLA
jgi:hypothetical protein